MIQSVKNTYMMGGLKDLNVMPTFEPQSHKKENFTSINTIVPISNEEL